MKCESKCWEIDQKQKDVEITSNTIKINVIKYLTVKILMRKKVTW